MRSIHGIAKVRHMHYRSLFAGLLAFLPISVQAEESTTPSLRRAPGGATRPIQTSVSRLPVSAQAQLTAELPPLPEGVEELKFTEFYKLPVGPRGLEPSEKLRALDGHRVRLCGFFVFEDWSTCSCPTTSAAPLSPAAARRQLRQPAWMKHVVPGRIMMAAVPVTVSLGHYGLCDDLPPQVAYLEIAPRFGEPVFYQPGIFTAVGKLTLATKEEPDGRTSYVHLKVEREEDLIRLNARSAGPAQAAQPATTPAPSATAGVR
jgi:hypothetical protein